MKKYKLTKEQLLADLYQAYYAARKHKRNKPYQLRFEANLDNNIQNLCDECTTEHTRHVLQPVL